MGGILDFLKTYSEEFGSLGFLLAFLIAGISLYNHYAQSGKARGREREIIALKQNRDGLQKRIDVFLDDREANHPVDFVKQITFDTENGDYTKPATLAAQYFANQTGAMAVATLILAEQAAEKEPEDGKAALAQASHWVDLGLGFAPDNPDLRAMQEEITYRQTYAGKETQIDFRIDPALTGPQLSKIGLDLLAKARFTTAKRYLERARNRALTENGRTTRNYATTTNNLAALLRKTGRLEEAETLFRQAMKIGEKTIGVQHPDYASHLNNLAELLRETGRLEEAEALFRQAIEIDEKTIGVQHPEYASHLNNLAALLQETGRLEEAETLYRQAMKIGEKTIGVQHPDYASRLNNLALVLHKTERLEEAETLYRQAIEIDEKTIGVQHPDYATRLNNLARLLQETGRLEEAEVLFWQAVATMEARLGGEHPTTQGVRQNLERLLAEIGSADK